MYLFVILYCESCSTTEKTPIRKYMNIDHFSNLRFSGYDGVFYLALNRPLIKEKEKIAEATCVKVKSSSRVRKAKPQRKSVFDFAPRFCALFLLSLFIAFCAVPIAYEYFRAPQGIDEIASALYGDAVNEHNIYDVTPDELIDNSKDFKIEVIGVKNGVRGVAQLPEYAVSCRVENNSGEKLVLTKSCVETQIDGEWYSIIGARFSYLSDESIINMLVKPEPDMFFEPGESREIVRSFWKPDYILRDLPSGTYRLIFRVCNAPNISKGNEDLYIRRWRRGMEEITDYAYISAEFNID